MTSAIHVRRRHGVVWLFGLLIFGAVVSIVLAHGEIAEFAQAVQRIQIGWLLIALGLQLTTYVLAGAIWQLGLSHQGEHRSLSVLIPLAFAMLFSNQAVPSVGLSGGLIVEEALARRGTARPIAMAALLTALLSTYLAFVVSLMVALTWAHVRISIPPIATAIAIVFCLVAAIASGGILGAHRLNGAWRARVSTWPLAGPALVAAAAAPPDVMRAPRLLLSVTILQLAEIAIDAATLGVSLVAIGVPVPPGAVFFSYVMAATGSRVAFAPLGIGTFEGICVFMLHACGVPIESALVATLVFRGLTLWLPMLPGLWFARRALR